jgi:hypothetical protein
MSFQLVLDRSGDSPGQRLSPIWRQEVPRDHHTFLDEVRQLDSLREDFLNRQSFQLSFTRKGCSLEWDQEPNQRGGRFFVLYPDITSAFHHFCLICCDWITGAFPFSPAIVGVSLTVKIATLGNCQIWVSDGFQGSNLEPRWSALIDWIAIRGEFGDAEDREIQIEYRVHPTYRRYRLDSGTVRKEANETPGFAACFEQALGPVRELPSDRGFDLTVATTHKRSWAERRAGHPPMIS